MNPDCHCSSARQRAVVAGRIERDATRVRQRVQQRDEAFNVHPGIRYAQRRRLPEGSSSNTWWVSFAMSMATHTTADVVEEFEVMAGCLLWSELWQTHF